MTLGAAERLRRARREVTLRLGPMHPSRRQEINRIAERVRGALDLRDIPTPVDIAVERLGGKVETRDAALEADALVKKVGDSFKIVLATQPETRRRFSVAHEIGHLFLHMGYIIDPDKWAAIDEYRDSPKFRFGFSEEEYEAHEFAGAFLMPAEEFRSQVRRLAKDGQAPLAPLADYFKVSTDAARVRGQWLRVFEWSP